MSESDARAVAGRLHIEDLSWVEELDASGPPPDGALSPAPDELTDALVKVGISEAALPEVAGAAPDPGRTPELWWLLERCAHRAIGDIGRWDSLHGPWPQLDASLGVEGRCFWIYMYLAVLPHIRRWHERRGIPDDVSWYTLRGLGRGVDLCRRWHGHAGLEDPWWYSIAFSGGLYDLGRLQYNLFSLGTRGGNWYDAGNPRSAESGFRPGDPVLGMHIPAGERLPPEACDDSLRRVRAFFPRYFPEHAFRLITCSSWLLDDQLAEHLPPTSNIIRFQRRFELVPGAAESDRGIFKFVFHRDPSAIDEIEPRTTLERAVIDHVRSGNHWRSRTGWIDIRTG